MKSLSEIQKSLESFEKEYGIKVSDATQGSEAWHTMKLGVISASHAAEVVAKKKTATRLNYMADLVAQIATGLSEEINSKYIDWGNQHEAPARATYEFQHDVKILQVPFVFKDENRREGCSPDGIIEGQEKGIEIKCPYDAANFVKFLTEGVTKSEYLWQCQYTLRVMNAEVWDFGQYHPLMRAKPIHTVTMERDPEKQKAFDDLIPVFIEDMDKMLAQVGIKFGDQWKQVAHEQ